MKFKSRDKQLASFLNTIILLGAVQGFIMSGLLFFTIKEGISNKLLGVLLFLMSLACLKIYLNNIGLTSGQVGSIIDAVFPFIIVMPVGPLIYFYVKSCFEPEFRITKKNRKHFYTVIIDLFHHFAAILLIIALVTGIIKNNNNKFGEFFDQYNTYSDIPRWISVSIYLWFSFRMIKINESHAKPRTDVSRLNLSWLNEFVWVFFIFDIIWMLFLIPYIIPRYSNMLIEWGDWYPIYLPIVVMIYWLGIRGYLVNRKKIASSIRTSFSPRLSISPELIAQVTQRLRKSMQEDKLYLDSQLNLTKLAQHIEIPPKIVSSVLNQCLQKSFNDYINQFRVDEIKDRLLKIENQKFTIAGLAYECGFNSQPTFQRAFKSIIGLTPKEFLSKNNS